MAVYSLADGWESIKESWAVGRAAWLSAQVGRPMAGEGNDAYDHHEP